MGEADQPRLRRPLRWRWSLLANAHENAWDSNTADRSGGGPEVIQSLDDVATWFHASESGRVAPTVQRRLIDDRSVLRRYWIFS